MDSVNQQQAEYNHEDLHQAEAVKKMQELAGKPNTYFFSTKLRATSQLVTC